MSHQSASTCGHMKWYEENSSDVKQTVRATENVGDEHTILCGRDAARKILEREEWTCREGKKYRIYPWEHGVWKCVRQDGLDGWSSVTVWYDADRDVVWWGYGGRYYFNPVCPAKELGQIDWYGVRHGVSVPRVRFTLFADGFEDGAMPASPQCRSHTAEQESALRRVSTPDLTTMPIPSFLMTNSKIATYSRLRPPPGLEDVITMTVGSEKYEPSDTDETSAGYTTPGSESSGESHAGSQHSRAHAPIQGCASNVMEAFPGLNVDAPHFVPGSVHDKSMEDDQATQGGQHITLPHRTPLTARAPIFKPALPVMPASDVVEAWQQQKHVQHVGHVSNARAVVKPASAAKRPLRPGRQRNGTAARIGEV